MPPEDTAADPHGLALLTALTAAEIWSTASTAQARAFFGAVGRRLAALEPMDAAVDLPLLATRANKLWAALDWGHVIFCMEEDGIAIRHQGLPHAIDGDVDGHWPELIAAVLEGVYDSWFRELGSGPALVTRAMDFNGGVLDLWHGR
ncbi:hypothetical protein L288_01425 [Sphingobium quisquiliarum P25]|uniref:Cellulose synthase operon protein D n=2 Tax=Sphingobium quisquiliarum TaxID=538379 RepID=T0HDV4_9SPHN|nr:hypothetical protein L288_01425 [Sphingobium quisquiliarum P25]